MSDTVSFLFDSNAVGLSGCYGADCDQLFFSALVHADTNGIVRTRVCRGDVLLHSMTGQAATVGIQGRTRTHEFKDDGDLRISLAVQLAALFAQRTTSLDVYDLAVALVSTNVYAITCGSLAAEIAKAIDRELRPQAAYVAMVRPDIGSAVEHALFVDYMFRDMAVVEHNLLVEVTSEGDSTLLSPHERVPFRSIVRLSENEFETAAPPLPLSSPTDDDPLIDKLRRKRRRNVRAGLLMRLMRTHEVAGTIDLGHSDESGVRVPEPKLARYSLDENNPKSELFRRHLALDASEWRFLRAQLETAIESAEPQNLRIEHDGLKFDALLPVIGRNGRSMIVRTGWIMRRDEPPQLTTVYIAKESEQDGRAGTAPPVVHQDLSGPERWVAIYEHALAAGETAAQETIPTPMFVTASSGHHWVIEEGECGGAAVILPDGRSSFARWTRRHQIGSRFHPRGTAIWARVNSQSRERAEASARAMARVFEVNGIDCWVYSYID